jgi:hypothetical protein
MIKILVLFVFYTNWHIFATRDSSLYLTPKLSRADRMSVVSSLLHTLQSLTWVFYANTGPEDISGGNLKLILGLVWTLIRRYQIGSQSKLPPKKMMLFWVNAVLHPHLVCTNFSTDWNDGLALQ